MAVETYGEKPNKPTKPKSRKRRIRRALRILGTVLLIVYLLVWWNVLRIVEHDHWPPPGDAVTPAEALEMTEDFVQRPDVRRDDAAIAYAPSTASDVDL